MPTATQAKELGQETPASAVTPDGRVCGDHVVPPSTVARIAAPGPTDAEPMAMQCSESEHAIPEKLMTVAGKVSADHDWPPFVVLMMLGELVPKSLTA